MRSLEITSGDLETTSQFGTWKRLSGNKCGRVARGYGNCWRLRWVASKARNITENALSILIVIFSYNSNKPRPQAEICVFSDMVLLEENFPRGNRVVCSLRCYRVWIGFL